MMYHKLFFLCVTKTSNRNYGSRFIKKKTDFLNTSYFSTERNGKLNPYLVSYKDSWNEQVQPKNDKNGKNLNNVTVGTNYKGNAHFLMAEVKTERDEHFNSSYVDRSKVVCDKPLGGVFYVHTNSVSREFNGNVNEAIKENNFNNTLVENPFEALKNKTHHRLTIHIIKYHLNNYCELSKLKLTVWITLSSTFGFFMLGGGSFVEWSSLMVGVFLCSCSANTFNQIFEKDLDKLMKRTMKRPLPNNKISLAHAQIYGFITAILGSFILYFGTNILTACLGVLNILIYTCVYTPLKIRTPYNTHVGSIVGSIPTLMGCTSVQENLWTLEPWILFVTQLLWQFPHFYSLAYLYKEDYIRGKYKMFPLSDKNGTYTAKLCRPYMITLTILPFILFLCGYTSYMYMLSSLLPNLFIYYKFHTFMKNPTRSNIRSFF